MSHWGWNRWTAVAVAVGLLAAVVVSGIVSEPPREARVDLDDAGIWITRNDGDKPFIGRVNTQIGKVEVPFAPEVGTDLDVAQVDATVVAKSKTQARAVDVANGSARTDSTLEAKDGELEVFLGGGTGIVLEPGAGELWVTSSAEVTSVDAASTPATVDTGSDAVAAVGLDGVAYAYSPEHDFIQRAPARGEVTQQPIGTHITEPDITAVGSQVALLDKTTGKLVLPGGGVVDLSGYGDAFRLQQPGPSRSSVLVAAESALLEVPLGGGDVKELFDVGQESVGAVQPVWLGGCAFAAWPAAATVSYVQKCDGRDDRSGTADHLNGVDAERLVFRTNRGRVVLNDKYSGNALIFTEANPIPIENEDWQRPPEREEPDDSPDEVEDCNDPAAVKEPELSDDETGTRAGRPIIVKVLDNDSISSCSVAVVKITQRPPSDVAEVAVVDNGRSVQVTPSRTTRSGTITFEYTVNLDWERDASSSATVQVSVVSDDENRAPIANSDRAAVEAGKTVRRNVLANDSDPDGDALTLSRVRPPEGQGTATFRSNGEVAFTASTSAQGEVTVGYTVVDERGTSSDSELVVSVSAPTTNRPPEAHNDRLEVVKDQPAEIDLLANDSDPNGDVLTVSAVDVQTDGLVVNWAPTGRATVVASQAPYSWTFEYTVTDGEDTSTASLRVDSSLGGQNRPPIAVRDDVVARPGSPALVDLTANDIDPDGDVLAVTKVDPPEGMVVELLDLRIARVTVPAGFEDAQVVSYTVQDGHASAEGVLVVRPYPPDVVVDQAPVTADDQVDVRAGNVTSIPVLANDFDPEGETLSLVSVDAAPADAGTVFVEGDHLRYQAPLDGPPALRIAYTVADPGGNRTSGSVVIRVLPAEPTGNEPPKAPSLVARTFAGSEVLIRVPLVGIDPEGDTVALLGVKEPPRHGHAWQTSEGLMYRADRGASGTDTFSFVLRDALGLESEGTVRVAVVPVPSDNSKPVAVPDQVTVERGQTQSIPVVANDSDPDGDALTLLDDGSDAPTKPSVGSIDEVRSDEGVLVYSAPTDATPGSQVSILYSIADGRGGVSSATVTITLVDDAPKLAPVARDDFVAPQHPGSRVEVDVLANDSDPDGAVRDLTIDAQGVPGATVVGQKVIVQLGDASLAAVYRVTDRDGQSADAVIAIPVMADLPPVCTLATTDADVNGSVSIDVLAGCHDPEGQPLKLVRIAEGTERGGSGAIEDNNHIVFRPGASVQGDAGFSFIVTDGLHQAVGGVVITVHGQNAPPVFASTSVELAAGGQRLVDLAALVIDPDPDEEFEFTLLDGTTDAITASVDGSTLRINASDGARGATASLGVSVRDRGDAEDTTRIAVRVLDQNGRPPVAVDDTFRTTQNTQTALPVTANDVDPTGGGLTVTAARTPHGTAEPEGQYVRFSPAPDFVGTALVTYTIRDASDDPSRTSTATAFVNVIGAPSKPGTPTGNPESRLVNLRWAPASPNGAPITRYTIEGEPGIRQDCDTNACIVRDLTNGQPYRFRVAAWNDAVKDESQLVWSDFSEPLTPDASPVMAAPTLEPRDGAIFIRWTVPVTDGSALAGYEVRRDGVEVRPAGLKTEFTWEGLSNGTVHSFEVRALTATKVGEWSGRSATETPAGLPGQPGAVSAVAPKDDHFAGGVLMVSWDWNNSDIKYTNGAAAIRFEIAAKNKDGAVVASVIADGASLSKDIPGLTNGVQYDVEVVAVNKVGRGAAATAEEGKVLVAGVPGVPGRVPIDAWSQSSTLLIEGFEDPLDTGGSPITERQFDLGGDNWKPLSPYSGPWGDRYPWSIDGLVNGDSYRPRFRACNAVGCGAATEPMGPFTPWGAPDPPGNLKHSVQGNTITWTWNAAKPRGQDIHEYQLQITGLSPIRIGGSQLTYTTGPLPPGEYTLTITAWSYNDESHPVSDPEPAVIP